MLDLLARRARLYCKLLEKKVSAEHLACGGGVR